MKIKTEYIIYFSIIILFIALSLTFILLIRVRSERNKLFIELQSERLLGEFLNAHIDNKAVEVFKKNKDVLGFGLYNFNGFPIIYFGSAPKRIFINPDIMHHPCKYNRNRETFQLIRIIGNLHYGRKPKHIMPHMLRNDIKIGFIELKVKDYFRRRKSSSIFIFLFPISFLILIVLILILYKRNMDYKNKIEKQKELVKLGEISRTLSHEIKNPLGAIKLQIGYLKKIHPKDLNELRVLEEETDRISLLTDRIGDFLRNPVGKVLEIDIYDFIRNIVIKYKDNNIVINNKLSRKYFVKFDKDRLRSVLENIIINAIESGNNIDNKIDIELEESRDRVIITINDNGEGLPADYENNIFDPFYTNKTKGSGLGLAISKRFIEARGGKIEIFNKKKGKGTTVKIII